ncbi:MAG: 2-oxoglutarate dehydrogenase E2 component (dihydrolipoamide succinyltransferase) [Maribacter sp.]
MFKIKPYMAKFELIMPKMGESIMEATILKWVKQPGDSIELDETVLEIATDKVDSEVPSPVEGILKEILFQEDDTVEIGKIIAIIEIEGAEDSSSSHDVVVEAPSSNGKSAVPAPQVMVATTPASQPATTNTTRFYSPLVKNIAQSEQISMAELEAITGSGQEGRVTKKDILSYVEQKKSGAVASPVTMTAPAPKAPAQKKITPPSTPQSNPAASMDGDVEIIEMDRMRKLIANHMVMSKHTSPHVTSFVEADVTNLVNWRNKVKHDFQKKHGEKITFTPIFIEALAKTIRDFPMINVTVDGTNIIRKKNINVGMATALPSGNLIVPVIKNTDQLNLLGVTKQVNALANAARNNKLKPSDVQGGTYTITNVGTFGNVMGTPIINQPQVAIMSVGVIKKKPAVIETEYGDVIAIRHMMYLSHSYDHRVVDGFLGGSFLRKFADYLEAFDVNQTI